MKHKEGQEASPACLLSLCIVALLVYRALSHLMSIDVRSWEFTVND